MPGFYPDLQNGVSPVWPVWPKELIIFGQSASAEVKILRSEGWLKSKGTEAFAPTPFDALENSIISYAI
jgi:hypothetical protein